MADTKISALTSATLPLSGSELVPIVQSGTTVKTAISNIASNQPPTPYTANGVVYASSTSALATGSALVFTGTNLGIGTSSPASILQVSATTPVVKVTGTSTTASSQDFTTNSAAQRATIGVEQSTGGGLFAGSSAYAAVFGSAGASSTQFATNNTVRMTLDTSGNLTFNTSNAGIVFNNSSALTNSTLNDYETGTWTPNQGAGLTVVGTFSSSGRYTKIGNMVFLQGYVSGSTSVALSNGGAITYNMPFAATSTGSVVGIGGMTNASGTVGGTTDCGPSSTTISATPAIAATATVYFSLTYQTT